MFCFCFCFSGLDWSYELGEEYQKSECPSLIRSGGTPGDIMHVGSLDNWLGWCWPGSSSQTSITSFHSLFIGSYPLSPAHTQGKGN